MGGSVNTRAAEIVVRDSETKKWIGSVYYGYGRDWVYEAYDGTQRNLDGYKNASEALEALLEYLS